MSVRTKFSLAEFDRAAAICRMERDTIAIAKAVLVDGNNASRVAADHGVTRQWVSTAVGKMREYIAHANPVPPGWVADTVTLPKRDWPAVRKIEREARAKLRSK